jgi:hypothetical protein
VAVNFETQERTCRQSCEIIARIAAATANQQKIERINSDANNNPSQISDLTFLKGEADRNWTVCLPDIPKVTLNDVMMRLFETKALYMGSDCFPDYERYSSPSRSVFCNTAR